MSKENFWYVMLLSKWKYIFKREIFGFVFISEGYSRDVMVDVWDISRVLYVGRLYILYFFLLSFFFKIRKFSGVESLCGLSFEKLSFLG